MTKSVFLFSETYASTQELGKEPSYGIVITVSVLITFLITFPIGILIGYKLFEYRSKKIERTPIGTEYQKSFSPNINNLKSYHDNPTTAKQINKEPMPFDDRTRDSIDLKKTLTYV